MYGQENGQENHPAAERLHQVMRKVPKWILTIICLCAIFWLTLAPHPLGEETPMLFPGADKVVHGIMFFSLVICVLFDTLRSRGWHKLGLPLLSALTLAVMFLGIGIEFLQPKLGRGFEIMDMAADAIGAVVGGALWILIGGTLGLTEDELKRHTELGEAELKNK